jgi:hypothetical protein
VVYWWGWFSLKYQKEKNSLIKIFPTIIKIKNSFQIFKLNNILNDCYKQSICYFFAICQIFDEADGLFSEGGIYFF